MYYRSTLTTQYQTMAK